MAILDKAFFHPPPCHYLLHLYCFILNKASGPFSKISTNPNKALKPGKFSSID